MVGIADAALSPVERRVLDRLVDLLRQEFGAHLRAVWLYGSRARGELPHDESDVDLLIISDRDLPDDDMRVIRLVNLAAKAEGGRPAFFSTHLYTPEHVARRREIRSFFMYEVDRDKIVLFGAP